MLKVEEATRLINAQVRDYGSERIALDETVGRVLAEDVAADRDFPPFDRVSMDGIAIDYTAFENGRTEFRIEQTIAAGEPIATLKNKDNCMEVMTGAVCPEGCDTVIRYEDLEINDGVARLMIDDIRHTQNVHNQGIDRTAGDTLIKAGKLINAADIAIMATVGKAEVLVRKNPRVCILSNGDELVQVHETPEPHQIRRSNVHALSNLLKSRHVDAETRHISDDRELIREHVEQLLQDFDVLLMSGGVSMGKFDHLPSVFDELGVEKVFHKIQQRPGKPFWFGKHPSGTLIFAFPGNPVSTFMCAIRYFIPWLNTTLEQRDIPEMSAILSEDFHFRPTLQYFLPVKTHMKDGQLYGAPRPGHGSGDLANLTDADGFLELPIDRSDFQKGEAFRFWTF